MIRVLTTFYRLTCLKNTLIQQLKSRAPSNLRPAFIHAIQTGKIVVYNVNIILYNNHHVIQHRPII